MLASMDTPPAAEPRPPRALSVLVAYSSLGGATRGVAERIATRLRESGLEVVLRTAAEARGVADHDAIVFGGAVYNQAWPLEGRELIRASIAAMAERPTWLFSVGSFGDTKRMWGAAVRREPKGIESLCRQIEARDYRVFAGVVRRDQWPWYGRLFFRALGGRFGDNRDWPAIDAFAMSIAAALREPAAA